LKRKSSQLYEGGAHDHNNIENHSDHESHEHLVDKIGFFDIFVPFKLMFWKFLYGSVNGFESSKINEKVMGRLNKSEKFFNMAQEFFDDDVCVETLIRAVHKLQASVAALIEGNDEAQNSAKLMYFSNHIIYET
jgi:hypothetical protein